METLSANKQDFYCHEVLSTATMPSVVYIYDRNDLIVCKLLIDGTIEKLLSTIEKFCILHSSRILWLAGHVGKR